MTLLEASDIIRLSTKFECRDHSFGDREVYWEKNGIEIASGYFGSNNQHVTISGVRFTGQDAYALDRIACFRCKGSIVRNDETGESIYRGA